MKPEERCERALYVSAEQVYIYLFPEGENDEEEYIEEKVGPIETFAESLQRRVDGAGSRVVNQRPV